MDANAAWIRKLEDEVAQAEVQVGHTLDSKRRGKGPLNGCTRPSDGDRRSYNQKKFNKNRADQRLEKARKKLNDARKELAAEAAKKELAKKHDLSGHKAGVQAAALATRPEILPSDSVDCDFEHQDCKTGVRRLFVNETALASRTVSPSHDGNCLQRTDPEARRCPDGPHGRHFLLGASDDAYDGTSATTTALRSAKPKPAEPEVQRLATETHAAEEKYASQRAVAQEGPVGSKKRTSVGDEPDFVHLAKRQRVSGSHRVLTNNHGNSAGEEPIDLTLL